MYSKPCTIKLYVWSVSIKNAPCWFNIFLFHTKQCIQSALVWRSSEVFLKVSIINQGLVAKQCNWLMWWICLSIIFIIDDLKLVFLRIGIWVINIKNYRRIILYLVWCRLKFFWTWTLIVLKSFAYYLKAFHLFIHLKNNKNLLKMVATNLINISKMFILFQHSCSENRS